MSALKPCPFCGAGETRVNVATYWTGRSSDPLSATVRHWCERQPGQPQSVLELSGRTEADAIAAWNRRIEPTAAPSGQKAEP